MTNVGVRVCFMMVALGLLTLHLYNEFPVRMNIDVTEEMSTEEVKIREPPINTSYVYSWPKCQPNISAADIKGFRELPDRIKDFLYYQHCRHFPMILDIPDKCGGANESSGSFLLLVIKSSPGNYERREVLRNTWAKERSHNGARIQRVFLSGTTGSGFEKVRLNKLLELEYREHKDILQWDIIDTFCNLTLKQVLFLDWMERNCPKVHFLFDGDDDVFVNTDNMVAYLQSHQKYNGSAHLFSGALVTKSMPIRDKKSKYYVPDMLHGSFFYPPYCSGGGFLMSGFTALAIFNVSGSVPFVPIDDAYMGMCLAKAGLKPAMHSGVRTIGLNVPSKQLDDHDPCFYKDILLVHRFLPAEMYLMWHRLNDPKLICDHERKSPRSQI